jgi:CRP-like cAMP-binding protein
VKEREIKYTTRRQEFLSKVRILDDLEFKKAIIEKLEALIRLVAVSTNAQNLLGGKNQKEQIKILSDLGLSRNIIALVVGTTPETVSVRLSEMKSKTQPRKGQKSVEKKSEVTSTE